MASTQGAIQPPANVHEDRLEASLIIWLEGLLELRERPPRPISTPTLLLEQVRQVVLAFRAHDEHAARVELRRLAAEARLLASMYPLPM